MSLITYHGPKDRRRARQDLPEDYADKCLRKAKAAKKWIPPQLSFEEILKNKPLPPCSLNDFMDYLKYVEQRADYLQFFMWYIDYVERWTNLSRQQKSLAPRWDPEAKLPSHKRSQSDSGREKTKLSQILDILDHEGSKTAASSLRRNDSDATNFSLPRIPEPVAEEDEKWQPFSSHPFRDEVNTIVRHYITVGSPRQIGLSKKDRTACLHAIEQTTHPSALLPAFTTAEAVLRGELHPNFVRWSISNANRPTILALRVLGAVLLLVGLLLDVLFILSDWTTVWRLLSLPLFVAGWLVLIAALDGLSLTLHFRNERQLRPWDQCTDLEAGVGARLARAHHARTDTAGSGLTLASTLGADPLRKDSLRVFGEGNGFADEGWVEHYERKGAFRRVNEVAVPAQNPQLALLQSGVVVTAVLWAVALGVAMVLVSHFIPSAGLLR